MKKIFLMAFVGLSVCAARAGLSTDQLLHWDAISKSVVGFSYVDLKYALNGSDSYTSFGGIYFANDYDGESAKSGPVSTGNWTELLSSTDWSGYQFRADAYDENDKFLGSSDVLAYNLVEDYVFDPFVPGTGEFDPPAAQFLLNIPGPIPEPTSGLLLLLGVAGLALRRKTR